MCLSPTWLLACYRASLSLFLHPQDRINNTPSWIVVTNRKKRKKKNLCRTRMSDGSCHCCFPEKEAGLRTSLGCQGPSTALDQLPRLCSQFRTRGWDKPGRTSALRMGVHMGLPGWKLQTKAGSRNPVMGPGHKPHAGQASPLTGGWRDLQSPEISGLTS